MNVVIEIWPEHITGKAWQVLNDLATKVNPVLMGGWAVYLWTGALKSADIDMFVIDDELWKLGARVRKHPKLRKYHAVIEGVDIDIYTPSVCGLAIPAADVYANRWYALVREFSVLLPEPLLILKCEAAKARWAGRKGFKDRCDILSLLMFEELDLKLLGQLLGRYKSFDARGALKDVVQKSVEEYQALGFDPWTGRKRAREVLKSIQRR